MRETARFSRVNEYPEPVGFATSFWTEYPCLCLDCCAFTKRHCKFKPNQNFDIEEFLISYIEH